MTQVTLMQIQQRRMQAMCSTHTHKANIDNNKKTLLLGHHTLGIECKGVLSTGVEGMLVGNRVGVGLTQSTIGYFAHIYISYHGSKKTVLIVVSPL